MKRPNTFVVGAPKSGTSALCNYLKQHPHAFVCEPKEPHFFARYDMPCREQYYKNEQLYLDLFTTAKDTDRVLVDGSVWYLYCEQSIDLIAKFDSKAKIIVMLRRPDEMVYSFHSQALETFDEDVEDFTTAWKMAVGEEKRKKLPKYCQAPSVLAYDRICCYSEQLSRVQKHFPSEQIHIIFFEDFKRDTKNVYNSVLQFLGLEIVDNIVFEKINPNSLVRNKFIGQILQHPPAYLLWMLNVFKKAIGINKIGVREKLRALNRKVVPRKRLDDKIRADIVECYRDDISKLQDLTRRDLSNWLV